MTSPQFLEDPLTLVSGRLATFEKWPHTKPKDKCTPLLLSEAGFYHRTDLPDHTVQCFICRKLYSGWSASEDPMEQHTKHSPDCAYVHLVRDFGGGYEIAPREAVIEAEMARFRNTVAEKFAIAVAQKRERYMKEIHCVESAARRQMVAIGAKLEVQTRPATRRLRTTRKRT